MTFSKDEFMEDIMSNSMWPNNLDLDWDRVYELAVAMHEAIEDSINHQQDLIQGLILMEWLSSVATINYRALRNQMMGQMIDGNMTTEEIFAIRMTPKHKQIDIDVSEIFNVGGNIEDLMKGIGNAIQEAMQEVQEEMKGNPMEDILRHLKASGQKEGTEESFASILTALKEAVEDSPNEEE